jgi:hypothetical protein
MPTLFTAVRTYAERESPRRLPCCRSNEVIHRPPALDHRKRPANPGGEDGATVEGGGLNDLVGWFDSDE